MSEITYAYFGGLEKSRDNKGYLNVKGLATDDTLDLDQQICDPEWLKTAMPAWFAIGNIREQHDGSKAVGKATSMTAQGTGFAISAKIVDPVAAMKVEESVYNGFSIGIKGAYVDMNDPRAPKGVIKGGTIVEVSVVDRPANPSCSLELAKTVGGVMTKSVEMQNDAEEINNAPDQTPGEYYIPCSGCNGTGEVHTGEDPGASTHACEACGGTGEGSTMDSQHIPTLPATSNEALVAELKNDPLADKTVEPEEEKGYNPDQQRDDRGRFGSGTSGDAARGLSAEAAGHAADAAMHTARGDINTAKESHAQAAAAHEKAAEQHRTAANTVPASRGVNAAQDRIDHDAAASAHDRAAEIHTAASSDPKSFSDAKESSNRANELSQKTPGSGSKSTDAETEKGYSPDQPRDEKGRFGSGGGSLHTDAHEATRAEAVKSLENVKRGWNGNSPEPHGAAVIDHISEKIKNGATRDDVQKIADDFKARAEKLSSAVSGMYQAGAAGTGDYPTREQQRASNEASTHSDLAQISAGTWDAVAASGKSVDAEVKKNESSTDEVGEEVQEEVTQVKTVGEIKAAIEANLTKASDKMHSSKDLNAVRSSMIALIKSELDEMLAGDENEIADVSQLLCSLSMFLDWWTGEASENETEAPFTGWDMEENEIGDNMAYIGLGVSADLVKAVGAEDATDETKSEFKAEVRKALGIDEELVALKADASSYIEQIELLKAEMEIVKNFAAPSDISLMRPDKRGESITKAAKLRMEVKQAREQAKTVTADAALRELYNQKADDLEARLAELEQN